MKIAVITDDILKEELLAHGLRDNAEIEWITAPGEAGNAVACIDLLFTPDTGRINELKKLAPALVIINAVVPTLDGLPENFIRLNGWRSFLKRNIAEAACTDNAGKLIAEEVLACFNKTVEWVPDLPGFVSARVVSMIVNEAYFALEEKVSSRYEIDIAMKLGTNYPYGPFEWSRIIGLKNICGLLQKMAGSNSRYAPAPLLQQEAITG
jgi:3-hydroxybutyryl-CoA dehydrogenase